ncbi:MAG: hypothetical protein HZB67_04825 [Candidatus Aenigmarchaeota archaeon]|nr:hypothetical protein [Candidatus Aenigmarchaeota archaeon]
MGNSIRNLLVGLVILEAGIWLLDRMAEGIVANTSVAGFESMILQFKQFSNMIMIGLGIIIALLFIFYISSKLGRGKQMVRPS